jgi:segregation and condensation protein B
MSGSRPELEAAVEAILFVAGEPLSRDEILSAFEEDEKEAACRALEAVLARYGEREGGGVVAEAVAGGIRLATRPELHGYLQKFFESDDRGRLSMAALETLAIVAYRQPVTAPEIQELRGVGSSGVLKTLLERRLIRIAGRKQVVGKPFLYATTREFLMQFGLPALEDLPPLEDFEETLASEGMGLDEDREEAILRLNVRLEEEEEEEPEEPDQAEGDDPGAEEEG